jgi:hypothetical protein
LQGGPRAPAALQQMLLAIWLHIARARPARED